MGSLFRSLVTLTPLALLGLDVAAAAPWGQAPRQNPRAALANIEIPLSNGSASLPPPDNLVLKAISVGRGTQNYTCAATPATGYGAPAPSPVAPAVGGATAVLLDATPALPFVPAGMGADVLARAPAVAMRFSRQALERSPFPKDGVHYFDAGLNPIFDLSKIGLGQVLVKKDSGIGAPKAAPQGPNGAVDWLELSLKDPASNPKVSRVYRIDTAAGKAPPTCEGLGKSVEVEYAALYYFYGPA